MGLEMPLGPFLSQKRQETEKRRFQMKPPFYGGDKRDRTADLLNAIQTSRR